MLQPEAQRKFCDLTQGLDWNDGDAQQNKSLNHVESRQIQ